MPAGRTAHSSQTSARTSGSFWPFVCLLLVRGSDGSSERDFSRVPPGRWACSQRLRISTPRVAHGGVPCEARRGHGLTARVLCLLWRMPLASPAFRISIRFSCTASWQRVCPLATPCLLMMRVVCGRCSTRYCAHNVIARGF